MLKLGGVSCWVSTLKKMVEDSLWMSLNMRDYIRQISEIPSL